MWMRLSEMLSRRNLLSGGRNAAGPMHAIPENDEYNPKKHATNRHHHHHRHHPNSSNESVISARQRLIFYGSVVLALTLVGVLRAPLPSATRTPIADMPEDPLRSTSTSMETLPWTFIEEESPEETVGAIPPSYDQFGNKPETRNSNEEATSADAHASPPPSPPNRKNLRSFRIVSKDNSVGLMLPASDLETEDDSTSQQDPLPLQVWKRYVREHAVQRLHGDTTEDTFYPSPNSKFAIVPYWCPERAGNILHNLVNNVAWSILHNRTILFEYSTNNPQKDANAENLCQSILPRRELGFGSWPEAQIQWNLPDPVTLDRLQTAEDYATAQEPRVVYYPQIEDMGIIRKPSSGVQAKVSWSDHPMVHRYKSYVDSEAGMMEVAQQLYSLGPSYAHGMILRQVFNWSRLLLSEHPSYDEHSDNRPFVSIALHSRHIVDADDGRWINHEVSCLTELLENQAKSTKTHATSVEDATRVNAPNCVVYLMSDRTLTIEMLTTWLENEHGCRALTFNHTQSTDKQGNVDTSVLEHGPHSGSGFLRDLQFASQARTALVGNRYRSSYMLLEELAIYDKVTEQWANKSDKELSTEQHINFCALPQTKPQGYDYGPGTPTFVRPAFLRPLEPDAFLQEYMKAHSRDVYVDASDLEVQARKFVVVEYSCDIESVGSWSHVVSNALLFSIAVNRTLLYVETGSSGSCPALLHRHSWLGGYDELKHRLEYDPFYLSEIWESSRQVVVFPRSAHPLNENTLQSMLPQRLSSLRKLFSLGQDYVYGMLWNSIFHLETQTQTTLDGKAVAIYAHGLIDHVVDIQTCLRVWNVGKDAGDACAIVPVANSPSVFRHLQVRLTSSNFTNCRFVSPSTIEPDASSESMWSRQIALGSHAERLINLGENDVQSAWFREMFEFNRVHRVWAKGQYPPVIEPLEDCIIGDANYYSS